MCIFNNTQDEVDTNMTLAELINLSTQLHTQLYEHWGIFISIHLALLGGLFAFDIQVKTSFKVGFLLFYLLFAITNLAISINLLNQVDAIIADIQVFANQNPSHLESYLLQEGLNYSKPILIFIHVVTGLMVLVGVLLPSKP